MKKILVMNPGGSSTKIAVYEDKKEVYKENINHSGEELKAYSSVMAQLDFRKNLILAKLEENGHPLNSFDAAVGRGGLMRPIPGGTYRVNDQMVEDMKNAVCGEHASNLGSVLARVLGDEAGIPSFVVDPVAVDEFDAKSRITGIKDLVYSSWLHSLNHKAVARKIAEKLGGKYEDYNFIICHLGGGITVVPHKHGKMVDGSGGRTNGPFSSDRSGGLPAYSLIELCYSGKYDKKEIVDKVSAFGGMYDYLGTKDLIEIEERIENGDEYAALIYDAFVYQVAKEICMYSATLEGKVDRIVLTGGIAHSKKVVEEVSRQVDWLAPVEVVAGEMEMEALALGVLRVLNKEEEAKEYLVEEKK